MIPVNNETKPGRVDCYYGDWWQQKGTDCIALYHFATHLIFLLRVFPSGC